MNRSIALSEKDIERFWKKVDKRGPDECWNWRAAKTNGYGAQKIKGFHFVASRLSWIIHFGDIPEGLKALHKCDNPPCVNPEHLFLGTDNDNMVDKVKKGRATGGSQPGEKNGSVKLRVDNVFEIRRLLSSETISAISRTFKVSRAQINRIKNGLSWSWLK